MNNKQSRSNIRSGLRRQLLPIFGESTRLFLALGYLFNSVAVIKYLKFSTLMASRLASLQTKNEKKMGGSDVNVCGYNI